MYFLVLSKVIKKSTQEVMFDESWFKASEEVVLKVLQMPSMKMPESRLFVNLINWGRAQVDAGAAAKFFSSGKRIHAIDFAEFSNLWSSSIPLSPEEKFKIYVCITQKSPELLPMCINLVNWEHVQLGDEADVRAKIENCLNHIRFCAMDSVEFANLCSMPIPLSAEEKYKINRQKNSEILPEGFSQSKMIRCIGESISHEWKSLKITNCTLHDLTEPVILTLGVEPLCYLTGVVLYSLTDVNAGKQVHLTCEVFNLDNPFVCIASATFNDCVDKGGCGDLDFPHPVLMKQGSSFNIKVTYSCLGKQLMTAVFQTQRSHSWDTSVPRKKVTVLFELGDELVKPTVDICGLSLAQNLE